MPTPSRPVNVYDILSESWRETRVDMTLQFFLDPNERHGLGTLVMDALLRVLDGAPMIGREGKADTLLRGGLCRLRCLGEDQHPNYGYNRRVRHEQGPRDRRCALRTRFGHKLDNPLDRYAAARSWRPGRSRPCSWSCWHPEHRVASAEQDKWLSRSITYAELADEIKLLAEI